MNKLPSFVNQFRFFYMIILISVYYKNTVRLGSWQLIDKENKESNEFKSTSGRKWTVKPLKTKSVTCSRCILLFLIYTPLCKYTLHVCYYNINTVNVITSIFAFQTWIMFQEFGVQEQLLLMLLFLFITLKKMLWSQCG